MSLQSLRGMHDLFGEDAKKFDYVVNKAKYIANLYCFSALHLPIVEYSELFERNIGETSDIVMKEIYRFKDRSDNNIALRPEFTAGSVRSYIQNNMQSNGSITKFFSYGPLFRYDRPQAGRYRQFNQVNYEIIGIKSPVIDAECISAAKHLLDELNIGHDIKLNLNLLSLDAKSRYESALCEYLKKYESELSDDSKIRLEKNPMRILDSKSKQDIKILINAPVLSDFYSSEDTDYLDQVTNCLSKLGINFFINERLVRGLDYYTGIVFEFVVENESGDQITLLGGGRYDQLISKISGGKIDQPSIGFAAGIERLMDRIGVTNDSKVIKIGIISDIESDSLLELVSRVRLLGLPSEIVYGGGSLGKKISRADRLECGMVIISYEAERLNGEVTLKNLNNGDQKRIKLELLEKELLSGF